MNAGLTQKQHGNVERPQNVAQVLCIGPAATNSNTSAFCWLALGANKQCCGLLSNMEESALYPSSSHALADSLFSHRWCCSVLQMEAQGAKAVTSTIV